MSARGVVWIIAVAGCLGVFGLVAWVSMSAIPSWARVGAKVVCINDDQHAFGCRRTYWNPPIVGAEYTIVGTRDAVALLFAEIKNPHEADGSDWGYRWERFRPLITLEDDMEAHFSVLLDVKQPSPAEA